ncbi:hypothetical protein M427DRAFT_132618 [Gonapodya prolifera JEL478]|uniref:Anoctamin transmembrane domain-containing protein n=1 Tax=Gonapodya prolifera (strain JEL478) TaxID=1344416 RepID=A0A139AQA2_GONPJ|nr:hypothetical protein M427DRAFT_132618 [Gonapodya prolifera JEL478]|eukprot:KXS18683.1 hypothetical protein M427DRAFT_132618 [Gonapodya prolifera JEL478]
MNALQCCQSYHPVAFEYFYFQWLIPIASLGTFAWVSGFGEYRGWWGFTVVLWAIAFSAFWSRRAKDLSHRWGTFHIPTTERPLPTYREDDPFLNPFTGNRVHVKLPRSFLDQVSVVLGVASGARAFEKFPLGTVLTTMLISFPAQLLGFVVLLIANAVVFTVDTWVNEYYDGPWKTVMTLLPLTAFLLTGPPLAAGLTLLARKLNGLENHTTNTVRDRDLTFKLFAWNGMAALFPVLFLIYVYIPFSGHVWWLGNPPRRERLKQFIILILVVNQLVDMLVENLLPRVLTALSKQAEVIQRKGMRKMLTTDGIGHLAASTIKKIKDEFLRETSGDPLLDRIRSEAFRETYDVFTDFSEMTVQFGNILLFAIAFPLAPLVGLVNNYFELRTDANKFCNSMRRPIPKRVPGTAAWEDAMAVLCFMATLTNATLVSYYATDDCAAPCTGPIRVEWGEVAAAVVVAQVCFLAARNVIHTFAESVPIDSIEEQAERERIKRADLVAAIAPEFGPVEPRCDVFLPKDLHDIRAIVDSHAVAAASEGLEEGGGGAPASAVDSSIVGDEEAERLIDGATSYGTFE